MSEGTTTIGVTCNHCGAPLEVGADARFVTCAYCNARLEVRRTGSAYYTHVLESIDARTRDMADDLEAIRLQNEVERLDREWSLRRESMMVRGKDGQLRQPMSGVVGVLVALFVVGFGVFWTVTAASNGAPVLFSVFGVVFAVVVLVSMVGGFARAREFDDAEHSYHRDRERLLRQLHDRETSHR